MFCVCRLRGLLGCGGGVCASDALMVAGGLVEGVLTASAAEPVVGVEAVS